MGLNLAGLLILFGAVLAVPLLLGAVATLLAASEGAAAGPQLRGGRRVVAAAAGGLVGCVTLAGTTVAGLYLVTRFAPGSSAAYFLTIFVASALGIPMAYTTARVIAARLNRYRCVACRVRFRSPWPTELCPRCAKQHESAGAGWTVEEFAARLRELTGGDVRTGGSSGE